MDDKVSENSLLLLKLRSTYKRLQQFTWTIREIEVELPYENYDGKIRARLLKEYLEMIPELGEILKELNDSRGLKLIQELLIEQEVSRQ